MVSWWKLKGINPTSRRRPEIDVLLGQLAALLSGIQMKKPPVKTTQPKEFSLTKPKPAAVPIPELIPLQEKCKPVHFTRCVSIKQINADYSQGD